MAISEIAPFPADGINWALTKEIGRRYATAPCAAREAADVNPGPIEDRRRPDHGGLNRHIRCHDRGGKKDGNRDTAKRHARHNPSLESLAHKITITDTHPICVAGRPRRQTFWYRLQLRRGSPSVTRPLPSAARAGADL